MSEVEVSMVRIAGVCLYIYFSWRLDEFCVTWLLRSAKV